MVNITVIFQKLLKNIIGWNDKEGHTLMNGQIESLARYLSRTYQPSKKGRGGKRKLSAAVIAERIKTFAAANDNTCSSLDFLRLSAKKKLNDINTILAADDHVLVKEYYLAAKGKAGVVYKMKHISG